MALIQFDNPADIHARLKALSLVFRLPVTALVRRAVIEFVEREAHRLDELGRLAAVERQKDTALGR